MKKQAVLFIILLYEMYFSQVNIFTVRYIKYYVQCNIILSSLINILMPLCHQINCVANQV